MEGFALSERKCFSNEHRLFKNYWIEKNQAQMGGKLPQEKPAENKYVETTHIMQTFQIFLLLCFNIGI